MTSTAARSHTVDAAASSAEQTRDMEMLDHALAKIARLCSLRDSEVHKRNEEQFGLLAKAIAVE